MIDVTRSLLQNYSIAVVDTLFRDIKRRFLSRHVEKIFAHSQVDNLVGNLIISSSPYQRVDYYIFQHADD